jgi:hypothetical protein
MRAVEGRSHARFAPRGVALALLLLLAAEAAARLFWSVRHPVAFFEPDLLLAFYPELRPLRDWRIRNDDEAFDVLVLSGSVLHPNWGFVQEFLLEELTYRTKRQVWIHNLSQRAHSSQDSWRKYASLARHRFDVVLFYHGINETRANNCPPEVFREDYGHYSWYRHLRRLDAHRESRIFVLPYTLAYAAARIAEGIGWRTVLSRDLPPQEWVHHGAQLKTVRPFRDNLTRVLDLAATRGEPVLLMTFAYYLPADYDRERFERRELDYVRHGSPVELWGDPRNVVAGIEAHNGVVRELAARYGTLFVDQASLLPREGENFNDICHLSYKGSARFVENLLPAILPLARTYLRDPSGASTKR